MTVRRDSMQISLKGVVAVVTLVSIVAGGGASWAAFSFALGDLEEKQIAMEEKVELFVTRAEWTQLRADLRDGDIRQREILQALARIEERQKNE